MSKRSPQSPTLILAPLAAALALAPVAAVQAADGSGGDPGFVVARKVEPRIAYRGVPREDNVVHTRATTFPAGIFHGAVDTLVDGVAEDSVLAERGTANAELLGVAAALDSGVDGGARSVGGALIPIGAAGASSLSGSMRGVANTVTGAIAPMISAARANGGNGP